MRIKPPAKDKATGEFKTSTAVLCEYHYDKVAKRSVMVYLGSFHVGMNPNLLDTSKGLSSIDEALPQGLHLGGSGKRQKLLDSPVSISRWDVEQIQSWLKNWGTWRDPNTPSPALLSRVRHGMLDELLKTIAGTPIDKPMWLTPEVSGVIRGHLKNALRAEVLAEMAAEQKPRLDSAAEMLGAAGVEVLAEAQRLRDERYRLSARDSKNTDLAATPQGLDQLQTRVNQLRFEAVPAFLAACRKARLIENEPKKGAEKKLVAKKAAGKTAAVKVARKSAPKLAPTPAQPGASKALARPSKKR